MPLGGNSGSGVGGGTTTPLGGACWISPSDLQGQIDPILDRLARLEEKVARLELGNVEANQLVDIAPQTGWITNYTFAGIGGWTLTQAGTLIPPPGVSFSSLGWTLPDLSTYNLVSVAQDGSLQVGLPGTIGGGGGSSTPDYASVISTTLGDVVSNRGVALTDTSPRAPQTSGFVEWRLTPSQSGIYQVNAGVFGGLVSPGYCWANLAMIGVSVNEPVDEVRYDGVGSAGIAASVSALFVDPPGAVRFRGVIWQYAGGYQGFDRAWFSVIRLGDS